MQCYLWIVLQGYSSAGDLEVKNVKCTQIRAGMFHCNPLANSIVALYSNVPQCYCSLTVANDLDNGHALGSTLHARQNKVSSENFQYKAQGEMHLDQPDLARAVVAFAYHVLW